MNIATEDLPQYPQKGMALALAEDRQHVLLVPVQVNGPGEPPQQIGRPTDVTQGFYATLLTLCPAGEKTPVYGGGRHVMDITIDLIPEGLQQAVPEAHKEAVPEFKAPARKKLNLEDL